MLGPMLSHEIIDLFINEVESILESLRDRPNYVEMENDMHALKRQHIEPWVSDTF